MQQQAPARPVRETTMRKTLTAMMGRSRNLSQLVVLRADSHIPPARIGIERRKVRKFRSPIRLLLMRNIFFSHFPFLGSLWRQGEGEEEERINVKGGNKRRYGDLCFCCCNVLI